MIVADVIVGVEPVPGVIKSQLASIPDQTTGVAPVTGLIDEGGKLFARNFVFTNGKRLGDGYDTNRAFIVAAICLVVRRAHLKLPGWNDDHLRAGPAVFEVISDRVRTTTGASSKKRNA